MNANRFFSVPQDGHHRLDMERLMMMCGGVAAYGRWHILLGLLFQAGGRFELNDHWVELLERELRLDKTDLGQELIWLEKALLLPGQANVENFLDACAEVDVIDPEFLEKGIVASHGVCDEIEYRRQKEEAGRKGGLAAKTKKKAPAKSNS